ncbi:MAG: hypothetical protein NTW17_02055 [Candidatus Pacearchaeota archaeon]|nr:hypothetical protein [Candidatus Pacearchaeota archaeon]
MNMLIILVVTAILVLFLGLKWNSLRTKFAFLFILLGVLAVIFFVFLMVSGSDFNFSSIGDGLSSMRVYFLWLKTALGHAFEATGKVIGIKTGNSTG